MRDLALAVLFFLGLLDPIWAKGPYDPIRVGNWQGGAYTNDQTGEFSHCAASVDYVNGGGTLFIWISKDFRWSLGVFRSTIQEKVGNSVTIGISFDKVGPYTLTAWVRENHFFIAGLPGDNVAVEAFKAAKFVHVRTPSGYFSYSLTSTRELLPALILCVQSHVAAVSNNSPVPIPSSTPAPAPAPTSPPPNPDADAAREKLLKETGVDYNTCVNKNMKEIVPYSSEGAETIAQVILTKCADIQKHFVDLTTALYGISQANAEAIISESIAERKKSIVADIVTFRAELTKTLMSQPKKPEPDATPTTSGQGL